MSLRPSRLDVGIFLLSAAVLLVELLLTRIFSVAFYYHLSFLVVSLAMLGLGLGGVCVHFAPRLQARWERTCVALSLAFSAVAVVAVGATFNARIDIELSSGYARVVGLYALCTLPFVCAGAAIALLLAQHSARANRLYFYDLVGAALACLLFIPLTNTVGAPSAVLVGAALAAAAASVFAAHETRTLRLITAGATWLLCALAVANVQLGFYDVVAVKGRAQPEMLAVRWNSFSRVEVMGTERRLWEPEPLGLLGYSAELGTDYRIAQAVLRYDADAATSIQAFTGDPAELLHTPYHVTAAAHQLGTRKDVLVIGPGGGVDVLTALHMGSTRITGVEINPLTVELMRTRFRAFSGQLYAGYPGVSIVVDEGRSYLQRSRASYDLIQASLVDTWAATAAGAHALSENSLYTVEAFQDYLDHLTPTGVVGFARWYAKPPVETLRVVALASEALRRRGVADPSAHVVVVRNHGERLNMPSLASILVKRTPFTPDELDRLHAWAKRMDFPVPFSLRRAGPSEKGFPALLGPERDRFIAGYPFDLSLVHDERPFFFSHVDIGDWLKARFGFGSKAAQRAGLSLGGKSLVTALALSGACVLLLCALPWLRRRRVASAGGRGVSALWALYFVGLGLGFVMVEVVLIQKLGLFLGYPAYALSIVLFTLLSATGVGSFVAQRFERLRSISVVLGALCAALLLTLWLLPRVTHGLLGESIATKACMSVALLAPLGLLMGMPFATGLRYGSTRGSVGVAWAWALNGTATVFGSALATLLAMSHGFSASLLAGVAAYGTAGLAALLLGRSESPSTQPAAASGDSQHGAGSEPLGALDPPRFGFLLPLAALTMGLSFSYASKAKAELEFLPPAGPKPPTISVAGGAAVRFGEGWHLVEQNARGQSWRWMGARGTLRARNFTGRATLTFTGFLPRLESGGIGALTLSVNGQVMDRIEAPTESFTRAVSIPEAIRGAGETVEVSLQVSATVKPPGDPRELGFCLEAIRWEAAADAE